MELTGVVVEGEDEAGLADAAVAGRADEDGPVRQLSRLGPATARELSAPMSRSGGQLQGVRAARRDPGFDHSRHPTRLRGPDTYAVGIVDSVSLRSRKRKLGLLLEELRPTEETTILDVGADELGFGEGDGCRTLNFLEELYPWRERITALGLHDGAVFRERYPQVRYVQGDALKLPFADGEFDIVFSNAVIEHVGGRERQRRFVAEALRVGRRAFVTTPNRRFPVEVHTRLPLVHWLPERLSHPVYERVGKGFATDVHLLTRNSLAGLFPGRVRIVDLGLTLVAIVD